MPAGFQLDEAATTAGFGVQPFGTSSFGGGAPAVLELPPLEVGSDDPSKLLRKLIGEHRHERGGVVLGIRKWAERDLLRLRWTGLEESFVEQLVTYHRARKFRLLPDATIDTTFVRVVWLETVFPNETIKRGRRYDVSLTLQGV